MEFMPQGPFPATSDMLFYCYSVAGKGEHYQGLRKLVGTPSVSARIIEAGLSH